MPIRSAPPVNAAALLVALAAADVLLPPATLEATLAVVFEAREVVVVKAPAAACAVTDGIVE